MSNFYKKYKLFINIAIAIILGILIGEFLPMSIVEIFIAINIIIGKLLNFSIPLIIIGFVINGISSMGKSSGKMLGVASIISYVFMVFASFFAYFVDTNIFPNFLSQGSSNFSQFPTDIKNVFLTQLSNFNISPIMDVVPALILSFIIGIGMSVLNSDYLKNCFLEFHDIIELFVQKIIVPILPFYVLGVFAKMSISGQVFKVISIFSKVFVVIISLHIVMLLFQFIIAGILSKKNPLILLKNIVPTYVSAVATQSSVAVIPITLQCAKKNEVSSDVAEFVIPLCSTIHLTGSVVSITSCSIAVMMLNGMEFSFSSMLPFMLVLGIMMIAAPGIPCGAILAATGILQSILGFDASMISLMIVLHVAQDGFGTACNVSGDCAVAVIIDSLRKRKEQRNLISCAEKA